MKDIQRMCRVCMAEEKKQNLLPIFELNYKKTASEIFLISGIRILDFRDHPALICLTCLADLSKAIIFRNRCIKSDKCLKEMMINLENKMKMKPNKTEDVILLNQTKIPNSNLEFLKTEIIDIDDDDEYPHTEPQVFTEDLSKSEKSKKDGMIKDRNAECLKYDQTMSSSKIRSIVKHEEEIEKEDDYKVCNQALSTRKQSQQHAQKKYKKSKDLIEGCHYCMKMFNSKRNLGDHIKKNHEYDEFQDFSCDVCGKVTNIKYKLAKHMHDTHLRKYRPKKLKRETNECLPCITCGKIFNSKSSLTAHEKTHKKIKPEDYYYCDICGNKFKEKCPMRVHIRKRHILKIRFRCEICPNKSWATNYQLKRHIKIYHYNIREFKCEWCGKDFGDKSKLDCHIRIHTGEQRFECQFCGRKYTHETDYRRHVYSHTGQRKHKCQSCRKYFQSRNELIIHRNQCNYNNYY